MSSDLQTTFLMYFFIEKKKRLIKIALKIVPESSVDKKSAVGQITSLSVLCYVLPVYVSATRGTL